MKKFLYVLMTIVVCSQGAWASNVDNIEKVSAFSSRVPQEKPEIPMLIDQWVKDAEGREIAIKVGPIAVTHDLVLKEIILNLLNHDAYSALAALSFTCKRTNALVVAKYSVNALDAIITKNRQKKPHSVVDSALPAKCLIKKIRELTGDPKMFDKHHAYAMRDVSPRLLRQGLVGGWFERLLTHADMSKVNYHNLAGYVRGNELTIDGGRLVLFPPVLGTLTGLTKLTLSNCHLLFLSDAIGNLVNLKELYIANDPFTTLPPAFAKLVHLERLYLSSDQLKDQKTFAVLGALHDAQRISCLPLTGVYVWRGQIIMWQRVLPCDGCALL